MIDINKCTIELNVNSAHYLVSEGNKMKGFSEHKGETRDRVFANCIINDCVKIKIAKML